jgi:hypothetical protein
VRKIPLGKGTGKKRKKRKSGRADAAASASIDPPLKARIIVSWRVFISRKALKQNEKESLSAFYPCPTLLLNVMSSVIG